MGQCLQAAGIAILIDWGSAGGGRGLRVAESRPGGLKVVAFKQRRILGQKDGCRFKLRRVQRALKGALE